MKSLSLGRLIADARGLLAGTRLGFVAPDRPGHPGRRLGAAGFISGLRVQIDAKYLAEIGRGQGRLSISLKGNAKVVDRHGLIDKIQMIHGAQREEQLGCRIEAGADPVQRRRHVLAHAGPIRARARHLDFLGLRKQAPFALRQALHDGLLETPLKQINEGVDGTGAIRLDARPSGRGQRLNHDSDAIDF